MTDEPTFDSLDATILNPPGVCQRCAAQGMKHKRPGTGDAAGRSRQVRRISTAEEFQIATETCMKNQAGQTHSIALLFSHWESHDAG